MKTIIKLEELAMTVLAIYLLSIYNLGLSVWVWIILFFSPDISMLGYAINQRIGAISYNLFHHKGIAIAVIATGILFQMEIEIATGLLLFGHASFDRMFGYGLKFSSGFKYTHLGSLEKEPVIS